MYVDIDLVNLLNAVDDAVKWFDSFNTGKALNGPNSAITIPEQLLRRAERVRTLNTTAAERLGNLEYVINSLKGVYIRDIVADELLHVVHGAKDTISVKDMERRSK